jgi:hypothetical protein
MSLEEKVHLQAAAVGAKTSVSIPPIIKGPDAAANTDILNKPSSKAVSCGF